LKKIARPPIYVPENMRILQLLELFKKNPIHFALVTDEYGGIQGLITLNDVLTSIVGEAGSEMLGSEAQVIQRKDGTWLVDGMLPIDEFKELFEIEKLPAEEKKLYRTVAGFCMMQLGRIPRGGDVFIWNKSSYKIVKMDGHRIEKILITHLDPSI
jgi:putative hemolysin